MAKAKTVGDCTGKGILLSLEWEKKKNTEKGRTDSVKFLDQRKEVRVKVIY